MTAPVKAAPRHWAGIDEVSFVAGMRLLFWICRVFGRWPFRLVLYPVLLWHVASNGRARRASADYLRRAGMPCGWRGVLAHFKAFAESILDKMLLWGGLYDTSSVDFFGQDSVNACLDRGQGALLLCAHLGNLELCRVLSRQRAGLKLTVLVHTRHAQAFNRMLARLNPDSQLNLLQVTEMTPATAIMLAERVARGEFVVIAADRVPVAPHPRVALAPFMGAPAPFPVGPYILAGILQCPVYLLFSLQRNGRAQLHFELFRASLRVPRRERDAALGALAADYAARLEYFCRQAPLEWFNFYDFWHSPAMNRLDTLDAPR